MNSITTTCYIDADGKAYGLHQESPSNPPTHVIEYTLRPLDNAERVEKYEGI